MYRMMNALCEKNVFVSVYDDPADTSKFKFGRILSVNKTRFAILLLSPNGDCDGIVTDDTKDVFRIDTNGQYHDKMVKLNRVHPEEINIPDIDSSCIDLSILSFAKEMGLLVSIELENSGIFDITGFIEDISETICKIRVINEYGYNDGHSYIETNRISQMELDSEYERRIMRLYQANA